MTCSPAGGTVLGDWRTLEVAFEVIAGSSSVTKLTVKPGLMAYTCNPFTWEAEVGGLGVQGYPWLLEILA